MTKITSIDLHVVTIDGKDEAVYLSQGEADSFVRAAMDIDSNANIRIEKRTAAVEGGAT